MESETSSQRESADDDANRLSPGVQWERYERYPFLLAKLAFYVLLIAGGIWVLIEMSAVVFPIFMAMLLAYLINPAVGMLEARNVPRTIGIMIIMVVLSLFVVVFAWVLYPTMADQVRKIGERAPQAWRVLEEQTIPWVTSTLGIELPQTIGELFEAYGQEIRDAVPTVADQIGAWAGEAITRTQVILVSLFNLVMIPVFTIYFLRDFESGKDRLRKFVPEAKRELILDRLRKMDLAVGQWFRGQIQVSLILAVLYAIGLGLVYGLTGHDAQSGAVIGLLTGFLNVIPYLGFAVGSVLAFIVVIIEWTGWWALIGVGLAFTVIQLAESYYITPRVMGDKVGMSPVAVIIVLLIGGNVAGLLGVVLAIPIAGAVKVLFPDVAQWYQNSSIYTGNPTRPARSSQPRRSEKEGDEEPSEEREPSADQGTSSAVYEEPEDGDDRDAGDSDEEATSQQIAADSGPSEDAAPDDDSAPDDGEDAAPDDEDTDENGDSRPPSSTD